MMRERFDRIEIVDLRGDLRAGTRGNVEADQGVFNIMVGTAITICIADGSKASGTLAEVTYLDAWTEGMFERRAKLDWLLDGAEAGRLPNEIAVERDDLDAMRPKPFQNGEWASLVDLFSFAGSGMQTKRDTFVYSPQADLLEARIKLFLGAVADDAREIFHDTRDRKWTSAHAVKFDEARIIRAAYRPMDLRFIYKHSSYGDFLRPELQEVWGGNNVGLYSLPLGTGAGPATWCHGLLPDYHAFRGSYGGYAFPLYDRRRGPDASNVSPALLASLGEAYGTPVASEDVFDAILCLLSATSYTRRFAEDLEDVFPHIPFPAQHDVFVRAVEAGREIRAVETFARAPDARFRPVAFCRLASEPTGPVGAVSYRDGEIALCADGSGRITGIPQPVWEFAVSGYRVLPRWIEGRVGLPADLTFVRELRDVAARIAELIHRFDAADLVLNDTLADTLTRAELGFPAAEVEEAKDDD